MLQRPVPRLPCHALFACLCHNPMAATLVCVAPASFITMCARIIQFCKDCPAGSYTTGTELSSPCTVFLHLPSSPSSSICVFASSIQFTSRSQGLHWAAGYLPVLAQGSQRLHLGSLATPFKCPVGWHMACQVRVSCLQQLETEKKEGSVTKRGTF